MGTHLKGIHPLFYVKSELQKKTLTKHVVLKAVQLAKAL